MKKWKKKDLPVAEIRRYLEPGPVVLVSSRWKEKSNVMTMGWHTMMAFSPSLVGCIIASGNHSHDLIRRSRECVINIPTADMLDQVVDIGNCSGAQVDKFQNSDWKPCPPSRWEHPCWRNASPIWNAACSTEV